jgi:hypothetical protein
MTHYEQWTTARLESLRGRPLESLEQSASSIQIFVLGQIEWGTYDNEDIWGDYGHVTDLRLLQQVINEKRTDLGLETADYFDSYLLG